MCEFIVSLFSRIEQTITCDRCDISNKDVEKEFLSHTRYNYDENSFSILDDELENFETHITNHGLCPECFYIDIKKIIYNRRNGDET